MPWLRAAQHSAPRLPAASRRAAGTVGGRLSAIRGQARGARPGSPRAGRSRWCADEFPDPAHAASGFLRVVAELLGHPADTASNAEPPYGGADPASQLVGSRSIRLRQPRREECCAPRVFYIQPGHGKPPRFHVWHGGIDIARYSEIVNAGARRSSACQPVMVLTTDAIEPMRGVSSILIAAATRGCASRAAVGSFPRIYIFVCILGCSSRDAQGVGALEVNSVRAADSSCTVIGAADKHTAVAVGHGSSRIVEPDAAGARMRVRSMVRRGPYRRRRIRGSLRCAGCRAHGLDQFGQCSRREICVPALTGLLGRKRLLVSARAAAKYCGRSGPRVSKAARLFAVKLSATLPSKESTGDSRLSVARRDPEPRRGRLHRARVS